METMTHVPSDAAYAKFETALRERVRSLRSPLFTTDATGLFEAYLGGIEFDRQHYNCKTCRRFIERYGGLATVDKLGCTKSALWGPEYPLFFWHSVNRMQAAVEAARVVGVHVNDQEVWGTPQTGQWSHLSGRPEGLDMPATKLKTAHQIEAEKKQDFVILNRSLVDYRMDAVRQAVRVLEADALDRSEKTLGVARWLLALQESIDKRHSRERQNLIWLAVATAPPGWCHVSTTMISTLLDDIQAGLRYEQIAARWAQKMHPLQYQRPTASPSDGQIARANKVVEGLASSGSLSRRFAKLEEVASAIWRPVPLAVPLLGVPAQGFFDHLKPSLGKAGHIQLPPTKMTWVKFTTEVLPRASQVEFQAPGFGPYFGLVTAASPDAPPILQWDSPDRRNPVSWFFFSGGSRAQEWGLRTGDWVKVNVICRSPAHWNGGHEHHKEMAMLVLEGAHLIERKSHGGYFPECLRSEYREIRSVLEAHARGAEVAGADEGTGNGFALQRGEEFNATVRVNGEDVFLLDRWE